MVCCVYMYFCVVFMVCMLYRGVIFFFFKQKTAYEMRISDWSSDVCSSDLLDRERRDRVERGARLVHEDHVGGDRDGAGDAEALLLAAGESGARLVEAEIGRASCRERVCQYV